jgi:hypothetical protein
MIALDLRVNRWKVIKSFVNFVILKTVIDIKHDIHNNWIIVEMGAKFKLKPIIETIVIVLSIV